MSSSRKSKKAAVPTSPSASPAQAPEDELRASHISDDSSIASSPRRDGRDGRPRFDSRASWADSTRFDLGRADSRASDVSARDLRLTSLSRSHGGTRARSDSRASRLSRSSARHTGGSGSGPAGSRARQTSFVSNFGVMKGRRDSNALSTITENWNLADDQFGSPFADFDAQGELHCSNEGEENEGGRMGELLTRVYVSNASDQPIREQLQRGLNIINDHTVRSPVCGCSLVGWVGGG